MGYPMDYLRVVRRNELTGNYAMPLLQPDVLCAFPSYHVAGCQCRAWSHHGKCLIAGDLRRLEHDQRDEAHLEAYTRIAGITPEQAKAVLDAFFDGHSMFGQVLFERWQAERSAAAQEG